MSRHEACPYCPSSDAFWRYDDGHGYCFSCHTFSPAKKTISQLSKLLESGIQVSDGGSLRSSSEIDTSSFTHSIRSDALNWLYKYGITAQEIREYNFLWDTDNESLVFPVFSNGVIVVTNSRYFGKDLKHPKYITKGKKKEFLPFKERLLSPYLIIVEDAVSYIKANRFYSAMCLLGSSLDLIAFYKNIVTPYHYKKIFIYLDPDKKLEAINIALKLQQVGLNAEPKYTMNDPKTDL